MTAGDVITIKGSTHSRKAAAFDGTDDYILADAHAIARVAGNDTVGTYSAWIYQDSIGSKTILSVGDNDSATEFLRFSITAAGVATLNTRNNLATSLTIDAFTVNNVALATLGTLNPGQSTQLTATDAIALGCTANQAVSHDISITYTDTATGASYTTTGDGHKLDGTCAE